MHNYKNMKRIFDIKVLLIIIITSLLVSCEINDPIDNIVKVGKVAPHVFWELPSSSVNAGDKVPFYAQYYTTSAEEIDRLEVWYDINEVSVRTVSCPLVSSFKYTVSSTKTVLSREFQEIENYKHEPTNWLTLKKAYILDTAFQTSKTLRQLDWKEVKTFDEAKFNAYFPTGFAVQFKDSMYNLLKVADFRKIMVSLNLMTSNEFIACTDSVPNPNTGGKDYFIKEDKKSELKSKYDGIQFKDLIYDASTQLYKVEYSKAYKLGARLKVIDKTGIEGIADKKDIELR
jgi:hypothetical protein